jgi:hypothetical protein
MTLRLQKFIEMTLRLQKFIEINVWQWAGKTTTATATAAS